MLARDDYFKAAQQSAATSMGCFATLGSSAGSVLVVSDRTMVTYLASAPTYQYPQLIESVTTIKQKVDIFTRRWADPTVTLTLYNRETPCPTAGSVVQLIDWEDANGRIFDDLRSVEITLVAGDRTSEVLGVGLSKLVVFDGLVTDIEATAEIITITATAYGKFQDKQLLTDRLVDFTALGGIDPPDDIANEFIPKIWGVFNQNFYGDNTDIDDYYMERTNRFGGAGLAKGFAINQAPGVQTFVVSDQDISDVDKAFARMGDNAFGRVVGTEHASSEGGWLVQTIGSAIYASYLLTAENIAGASWSGVTLDDGVPIDNTYVVSPENVGDGDPFTAASVYDSEDDGIAIYGALVLQAFSPGALLDAIRATGNVSEHQIILHYYYINPSGTGHCSAYLMFGGAPGGSVIKTALVDLTNRQPALLEAILADLKADPLSLDNTDATFRSPFVVVVGPFEPLLVPDHIVGNQLCFTLPTAYCSIRWRPIDILKTVYFECDGPAYGSWINGRGAYARNAGDVIEDCPGIIEDIMRNHLSLTSRIDTASFDAAYAANTTRTAFDEWQPTVKAKVQLHSGYNISTNQLFKSLCEQCALSFYWSASGMARFIVLNGVGYFNDLTDANEGRLIKFSWLVDGKLKLSVIPPLANRVTVNSRWHEEGAAFRNTEVYEDATSQSQYGVLTAELNCKETAPKYSAYAVTPLGSKYLGSFLTNTSIASGGGFWSRSHNVIEFETVGYVCADIEPGDRIGLDHTTFNQRMTCWGETWEDRIFKVIEVDQHIHPVAKTRIKAVELYTAS